MLRVGERPKQLPLTKNVLFMTEDVLVFAKHNALNQQNLQQF